jgi:hypothetical protein
VAIELATLHSRRALLAGSLGALGALVAQAIGRPIVATATDGDVVTVGDSTLTATKITKITNTTNANNVIWGASTTGVGIRGSSSSGFGGSFTSESTPAVRAASTSSTGVLGFSGTTDLPASAAGTGVYGFASDVGVGVRGESLNGVGVFAYRGAEPAPLPKEGSGVYGYAAGTQTAGVLGQSDLGKGVVGLSEQGEPGVFGQSVNGVGIFGVVAPLGHNFSKKGPIGVYGQALTGVQGLGTGQPLDFPIGVVGTSASIGVFGRSGTGPPPLSQGATPFGIFGVSNQQDDSGVGVRG